jgi:hypothetical protein
VRFLSTGGGENEKFSQGWCSRGIAGGKVRKGTWTVSLLMSDCFLISDVVFKPFPLKEDVRPGPATSSTISQMKIYWLNIQRHISR